jgi:hypothetical protein
MFSIANTKKLYLEFEIVGDKIEKLNGCKQLIDCCK